jgi:hypothetical protein
MAPALADVWLIGPSDAEVGSATAPLPPVLPEGRVTK